MPDLTVLGAINLDLTARIERAPSPGETVADGILSRLPGGKGANQAIAAARLGAAARMIGAVGDDAEGRELTASLAAGGVDVTGIQVVEHATGVALIIVDATGENSIVVCPGANSHIERAGVQLDPHAAILSQLEVPLALVEYIASLTDGFFALNASPVQHLPPELRERVDLFIVNEHEFDALPSLKSAPLVAVSLGARGAVLLREGREVARASVAATSVVNTVGAGDSFAAALTVGLLRGDDPQRALHRACAVGAAAVADPKSQPDLLALDDYPDRS